MTSFSYENIRFVESKNKIIVGNGSNSKYGYAGIKGQGDGQLVSLAYTLCSGAVNIYAG